VCYRVAESRTVLEANEQWDLRAETYQLQGELLLRQAALDVVQAEVCFQQAKSWVLGTTMSLSRLWQQQNKRDGAHELLAPIYAWFTEGFDAADR
jgi:Flp pilus assembly protein TadB